MEQMPDVWARFVSMEDEPDLAYPKWNAYSKETLHDRDEILRHGRQLTLPGIFPGTA